MRDLNQTLSSSAYGMGNIIVRPGLWLRATGSNTDQDDTFDAGRRARLMMPATGGHAITLAPIPDWRRSSPMSDDRRLFAPSAARNRDVILEVLARHLPECGLVLEIASGSGEHITHFAAASGPDLVFQPTDPDADARASIDAWVAASGLANVRPAIALDTSQPTWPVEQADAVLCINMIHISPWVSTTGLVEGAARVLRPGGLFYLYGPYKRDGQHTAESNARFDFDLRSRNPEWGVRDLEDVGRLAEAAGFAPMAIEPMPANNLSVLFRRQ
jgi:SAM-dependent methyltransferase